MLEVVVIALEVEMGMVNVGGVGVIVVGDHVTPANTLENVRSNRRSRLT